MKIAGFAIAILGFGCAIVAAWFWYRSSKVSPVLPWEYGEGFEPGTTEVLHGGWIGALIEVGRESARLNKVAALWTGTSALLSALSVVFEQLAN
jgi:hypothetical protein